MGRTQDTDYLLYSFPVCGASFFSTSPGLTCLRAGLSFFCLFGSATCVSVTLELMTADFYSSGGYSVQ